MLATWPIRLAYDVRMRFLWRNWMPRILLTTASQVRTGLVTPSQSWYLFIDSVGMKGLVDQSKWRSTTCSKYFPRLIVEPGISWSLVSSYLSCINSLPESSSFRLHVIASHSYRFGLLFIKHYYKSFNVHKFIDLRSINQLHLLLLSFLRFGLFTSFLSYEANS